MALTDAQVVTLKTDIQANTDPVVVQALADGNNNAIRDWYNLDASPDYWIWKTLVELTEVGMALNGQNLADITAANSERLQVFFIVNPGGALPKRADHRAFFSDVFSGANGAETRTALDALWRQLASNAEKLFADGSGTGSNADPDGPVFEGDLSTSDIANALAS